MQIRAVEVAELILQVAETDVAGVNADGVLRLSNLKGTPQDFVGTLALDLSAHGRLADTVTFSDSSLQVTSAIRRDGKRLTLRPTKAHARLGAATLQERLYVVGPTDFTLAENTDQFLELDLATGAFSHRLTVAPFELDAMMRRPGAEDMGLAFAVKQFGVSGARPGAERLALRGASLTVSAYPIAVELITADIVHSDSETALTLVAKLRHQAEPAFVKPITLRLDGRLSDDTLQFSSVADEPSGAFKLSLNGRHHLARNEGAAELSLMPMRFATGELQPKDLFPLADRRIERAVGTLGADGHVRWSAGRPDVELRITLDALGFTVDGNKISELTGSVVIDGIGPLTTPPGQRVTGVATTARLEPIPFEVFFQLRPDGRVAIESAHADFAGGRIMTRDARLDPKNRAGALALKVHSIDLNQLTRIADIEGLSGEGRISGTIPLAIRGGKVAISDGALAAEGAGVLRVSGEQLEELLGKREDTVGLMVQALSDFHYEVLDVAIEKAFEGEGAVRMHLSGSNPAVLEGYPFVFNINLTSNFDRLVGVMREGLATADQIFQRSIEESTR